MKLESLLTPTDYDAQERAAKSGTANRIIEACQSVAFGQEGYPVHIDDIRAAGRYVDVMQDGRTKDTFEAFFSGISADEMATMRAVATKVADVSERLYGRRQVPRSAMLRGLNVVRHIEYLYPERTQTILEIGAGSGYVGALLLQMGYGYVSTDIAQAFYIVQNHVMNAVAPGRVTELALEPDSFFDMSAVPPGSAVHVPWWKFVVPRPVPKMRVDAVTCNHALCEMHPIARSYSVNLSAQLLDAPGLRCFVFEGWGSTIRSQIWHVGKAFAQAGLQFVHNDVHSSIAARPDRNPGVPYMLMPYPGTTDGEAAFHPNIYDNPDSAVGARIREKRLERSREAKNGLPEFDAMLREVARRDDLETDDESFMRYAQDFRR